MTKRDFELIAQALRIAAYEARFNGADASDGVQIAAEVTVSKVDIGSAWPPNLRCPLRESAA